MPNKFNLGFAGVWNMNSRRTWVIFLVSSLIIQLLQAAFTELSNDEAYYWMYAQHLDWGYFDHPPVIALMIRFGEWFGHGEFFLRCSTVLLGGFTCWGMWMLCNQKDAILFIGIYSASVAFQIYGFIAIPDAPLLAFCTWYFVALKRYLTNDNWKNSLLISLIIIGLLYSKYHGILILIFTLIAKPDLFRRTSFYGILCLCLIGYAPHIYWQIVNDLPSWQFHVLNKSQSSYNPLDSILLPFQTVLMAGPIVGIGMFTVLLKSRIQNEMDRIFRFCLWGFFIFFLLSSFNAPIEANWMAATTVPLMAVTFPLIQKHLQWRKTMLICSGISIALMLFLRINLMTNCIPALGSAIMPEFYGWKRWAQELEAFNGGLPTVFVNSYQKASKYAFYTQGKALSLNNPSYRRNQFDLWDIADSLQGQRVAIMLNYDYGSKSEVYSSIHGQFHRYISPNFRSYQKVKITLEKDWYTLNSGSVNTLKLRIKGPHKEMYFNQDSSYPPSIVCSLYYYEQHLSTLNVTPITSERVANPWEFDWKWTAPAKPGPYYLKFGVRCGDLPPTLNSRMIRVDVE